VGRICERVDFSYYNNMTRSTDKNRTQIQLNEVGNEGWKCWLSVLTDTGLRGVGVDDADRQPRLGVHAHARVAPACSVSLAAQAVVATCYNYRQS